MLFQEDEEDEEIEEDEEVRCQMRSEMRSQELTRHSLIAASAGVSSRRRLAAAARIRRVYVELAASRQHLLSSLLKGKAPVQWQHYPENDAVDFTRGYQWFYHSHDPEDRPDAIEHGHFHLFARRSLWASRTASRAEKHFKALTGAKPSRSNTRHLISIGLNANGLPVSLFTVNSWVTGDLMLNAALTEELLLNMRLRTRHPSVDAVIESVIVLCADEVRATLMQRDQTLAQWSERSGRSVLLDQRLEVLSEVRIDLDSKL